MQRYKLQIAYDGSNFFGWQKQPNHKSVQGEIELALGTVLQTEIEITGSGRTDAGVHAEGQVAHVDLPDELPEDLNQRLNKLLSPNAAILNIEPVADNFHARFQAKWRQYRYDILLNPNPLYHRISWYVFQEIDQQLLKTSLKKFEGIHDFGGLSKFDPQQEHTNSDVHFVNLEELTTGHLRVRIRANRFLRNMVRRIVGLSVDVAKGKIPPETIDMILKQPDAQIPVFTAPARGLVLEEVGY